ncbi:hypothetical protein VTN00DRAFT_7978 [Thermoascus crustaceus]|uniref:uncharacterized protein n=1 Tax=Thermoascus crustaceus TaxID=5088 RepID=UPI0037437FF8
MKASSTAVVLPLYPSAANQRPSNLERSAPPAARQILPCATASDQADPRPARTTCQPSPPSLPPEISRQSLLSLGLIARLPASLVLSFAAALAGSPLYPWTSDVPAQTLLAPLSGGGGEIAQYWPACGPDNRRTFPD